MTYTNLSHKPLTIVALTVALMCASRTSYAETITYNGSRCHGVQHTDEGHLTRSSGTITTNTAGATITCPIIKYTSGPGITGDEISSVTVTASTGNTTCTFRVMSANKFQLPSDSNALEESTNTLSSANSWSVTLTSLQDGYWEGYEDHDTWYYGELVP